MLELEAIKGEGDKFLKTSVPFRTGDVCGSSKKLLLHLQYQFYLAMTGLIGTTWL